MALKLKQCHCKQATISLVFPLETNTTDLQLTLIPQSLPDSRFRRPFYVIKVKREHEKSLPFDS